jgi:hypothetical protein
MRAGAVLSCCGIGWSLRGPRAVGARQDLNAGIFEVSQVTGRRCRASGSAYGGDESIETCDRFPGPLPGAGDQRVLLDGGGIDWQDLLIEGPEGQESATPVVGTCRLVPACASGCRLTSGPAPSRCRAVPADAGAFRDIRACTEPASAVSVGGDDRRAVALSVMTCCGKKAIRASTKLPGKGAWARSGAWLSGRGLYHLIL